MNSLVCGGKIEEKFIYLAGSGRPGTKRECAIEVPLGRPGTFVRHMNEAGLNEARFPFISV